MPTVPPAPGRAVTGIARSMATSREVARVRTGAADIPVGSETVGPDAAALAKEVGSTGGGLTSAAALVRPAAPPNPASSSATIPAATASARRRGRVLPMWAVSVPAPPVLTRDRAL